MAVGDDGEGRPPLVDPSDLKPYASLMIVQSTGQDHVLAMRTLCNHMALASGKTRSGNTSVIVASGIADVGPYLRTDDDGPGDFDEIWAFIYQRVLVPGWSVIDSGYRDTGYELGVVMRRDR